MEIVFVTVLMAWTGAGATSDSGIRGYETLADCNRALDAFTKKHSIQRDACVSMLREAYEALPEVQFQVGTKEKPIVGGYIMTKHKGKWHTTWYGDDR